jgi:hypothetical protein
MNFTRHHYNENLKERSEYLLWLLFVVAGIIGLQLLYPVIKPNRYTGSIAEWVFTIVIITSITVYFVFHKRFVSIAFDDSKSAISLMTTTLLNGGKTNNYNYSDISYNDRKEFIEIYKNEQKLIKLEKKIIGEYCFDEIVMEFQHLKDKDDQVQ